MWNLGKTEIKRVGDNMLEIKIDGKTAKVFTGDLAEVVRAELPEDRAEQLFAEVDSQAISKGKVRVVVKAHKDIKRGDPVSFTLDVAKHLDSSGNATAIRANKAGILLP